MLKQHNDGEDISKNERSSTQEFRGVDIMLIYFIAKHNSEATKNDLKEKRNTLPIVVYQGRNSEATKNDLKEKRNTLPIVVYQGRNCYSGATTDITHQIPLCSH